LAASERRARATRGRARALPHVRHAVYRLAPDLLLVFKPRGHREATHAHPHRQRLQVLRGTLVVHIGDRRVTLTPTSRRLTLRAGRGHETLALRDTWLLAESLPA
jgi:hypothetical protein